jgi:hypothetical protein
VPVRVPEPAHVPVVTHTSTSTPTRSGQEAPQDFEANEPRTST